MAPLKHCGKEEEAYIPTKDFHVIVEFYGQICIFDAYKFVTKIKTFVNYLIKNNN